MLPSYDRNTGFKYVQQSHQESKQYIQQITDHNDHWGGNSFRHQRMISVDFK